MSVRVHANRGCPILLAHGGAARAGALRRDGVCIASHGNVEPVLVSAVSSGVAGWVAVVAATMVLLVC